MPYVAVFLFFALLAAGPAPGAMDPPWLLPDCPQRVVFRFPPRADSVLLRVPLPPAPKSSAPISNGAERVASVVGFAAYDSRGDRLRHRVLHTDAVDASVLVCGAGAPGNPTGVLYCGPVGGALSEATAGVCRDDTPLAVEVCRQRGQGVPTTWERMAYLYGKLDGSVRSRQRASFEELSSAASATQDAKRVHGALLRVQTVLLCPTSGVYRLAIDCRDAGLLRLDKAVAAAWLGEHPEGEWREGPALPIEKGPHVLELFLCSMRPPYARVGWRPPGASSIQPLPAENLVASTEVDDLRVERKDRSLHPAFTFDILPAYTFRGVPATFVPVRFRNASANWLTTNLTVRWRFDGAEGAEGPNVVHVFKGARIYPAAMEVRDNLGNAADLQRGVDGRDIQPTEYAPAAELGGLPAVCFERDPVEPALTVSGSFPASAEADVSWVAEWRDGTRKEFRRSLQIGDEAVRLPLGKMEAGSLARIAWTVAHRGVALRAETVRFLRPPFDRLPNRVAGDRLLDGAGHRLVLIPYDHAGRFAQPVLSRAQAAGRIVCVDDWLAPSGVQAYAGESGYSDVLGRLLSRPAMASDVRHAALPPREKSPDSLGPLLKLVQVPAALGGAEVAILSVGSPDILSGRDLALFERDCAALSDIVSGTLNCPVVWVTPSPHLSGEAAVRPFAAAVQRVADARRMPVADLFTAFLGMGDARRRLVSSGGTRLSESGRHLAAQVIARALLERESL